MTINISEIRKDYTKSMIDPSTFPDNPVEQFRTWLGEAIASQVNEPTAMVLSTVSKNKPSSRVVLLKEIVDSGFVFYTNYESEKGREIAENPNVCLNFFWAELERQVRIEGIAAKVSRAVSEKYFKSRPKESQIGAWASPQSQVIESRKEIEENVKKFAERFKNGIELPPNWGGYVVEPNYLEFWQGGASRLHDRVIFEKQNDLWKKKRLAP
jgi:pyridoxamine 5'-phosphate oxidase